MSQKTGCGLLLILAIVAVFVVGLVVVSGKGRLSFSHDAAGSSTQAPPLSK